MRRNLAVYLAVIAVAVGAACPSLGEEHVTLARLHTVIRDGDLVFQQSNSAQSAVIAAVSGSRYTHVGLLFGANTSSPYVIEAVQPVRRTPLAAFVRRGHDAHFELMRLRDEHLLSPTNIRSLKDHAELLLGLGYDGRFEWSDTRMYCSELVWKVYERALSLRLSAPQRWRDLDLSSKAARALAKKRRGQMPEPDALVITPAQLMRSPLLRSVLTGRLDDR